MRKKLVNSQPTFRPGQKKHSVHGGGGPENAGAKSNFQAGVRFLDNQPPHSGESQTFGEYFGPAAPSTKPNLAGIPANNFRTLGDTHGGRA